MQKPQARVLVRHIDDHERRRWWCVFAFWLILGLAAGTARAADHEELIVSHGYSFYGNLSYPADYTQFNYVNPEAPKGGEIAIGAVGTFDSMNPYSRKGRAPGLSTIMYESLLGEAPTASNVDPATAPADVLGELYCLLCERLEYPPGKEWVIFYMRPEAQFSDGTPLTAHDVGFSHNLFLEQGLKSYAEAVKKRVPSYEVIDDHTIKFYFSDDISRRSLINQVGTVPVFSQKWYEETGAMLDESRLEISPGSGAYMLGAIDINRRITYTRNENYWAKDLPFNVGRNNFDTIRVEYFGDDTAAFEAFKAGEYTFNVEGNSRRWATQYDFPKANAGQIVREELPDGAPAVPTGIVFNLGREVMKDKRVREALALAYNFEWTNDSLQYGLFKQRVSFSQDTPVMATGVPEGSELEFLQSLGDIVPAELLEEEVRTAHTSNPERLFDRRNARQAMRLLDEAGYTVSDNGTRVGPDGRPLRITFLFNAQSSASARGIFENYVSNVEKLGVDVNFEVVDGAQFTSRRRDRDYDLIFGGYYPILEPGTGLRQLFGSEAAEYSLFNPAGLASPLVDQIIDKALLAGSKEEELAAMQALDRALRYEFALVPVWYNDDHWVAYYDMYGRPEKMPPYFLGYMDFWWFIEDKAAELRSAGALR
ncbi:MAG: extracellular solute-binding protein [Paracoccaceae bacterium]